MKILRIVVISVILLITALMVYNCDRPDIPQESLMETASASASVSPPAETRESTAGYGSSAGSSPEPSSEPSSESSPEPSSEPSSELSPEPSPESSFEPSSEPSPESSPELSPEPSPESPEPSPEVSAEPSESPKATPESTPAPEPSHKTPPRIPGNADFPHVELIPVEYALEDDNVVISGETVYVLNRLDWIDTGIAGEYIETITKPDVPKSVYFIVTGVSGVMPHGRMFNVYLNGSVIEMPDVGNTGSIGASLLDNRYLFIASRYVYGNKLSVIDLEEDICVFVNDVINKSHIESFEIHGDILALEANNSSMVSFNDGIYETIELNFTDMMAAVKTP